MLADTLILINLEETPDSVKTCRCTVCALGTEQVDVRAAARCIFLCINSAKSVFGLSALTKYACGLHEGPAESSDYSAVCDGRALGSMQYFGILNKTHARHDCVIALICKLVSGNYIEEYFIELNELGIRKQRKALRMSISGVECFNHPEKAVFITCIK